MTLEDLKHADALMVCAYRLIHEAHFMLVDEAHSDEDIEKVLNRLRKMNNSMAKSVETINRKLYERQQEPEESA